MEQIQVATRQIVDEMGEERTFIYSIVIEVEGGSRFAFEHYGIAVSEVGGDCITIPAITPSAQRIDALITLLVEGCASPTVAGDVVADWL